ncbi:secondary thiamine-phosphate synthase enzyme YjbQ [Candidatus Parcubacteria bacterium]|nr:secondary thiamine-phosphate synthase enzyme YjbQ [Candidatus Parcubacteria bacterium]
MFKEFNVSTENRYQLIDITEKVEEIVKEGGVKNGLVFIFVPHSTASIILTENEEGLKRDWLEIFKKLISGIDFQHNRIDNNADSHILSGLAGQGKILPIKDGRTIRGTWQQIFLVEFDGPRTRKIIVKIIEG